MKTLYEKSTLAEVTERINRIKADSAATWGKMNAPQMLEHCARTFDYATGRVNEPRLLIGRILGPFFKDQFHNDKPIPRNTPTAKSFTVNDTPAFEPSRQRLLELVKAFSEGGAAKATRHPSPFFGKLTPEQLGKGQYKHLDHHLQQFGV